MNRSQWYILTNLALLLFGTIAFYYTTPKFRKSNHTKLISQEKERNFRKEVIILDSLYKKHVAALSSSDQIAIASSDAVLETQFALIKKEYSGQTPPALLASKLIRNYQVRVLLNKHILSRRIDQADEIKRVNSLVSKLEEQNAELKSQNQMIRQVLLSLP
ncbi:hypothetical protein [Dyadobacter aurulentus]|uniref:hypothetical protein n=1 Tax=Dyadobacter sp. UC 10 TaxID=2605428 RepID=UPI0011F3D2D5|nr:hypothetical protein [Dyadobacter sp. UC 10]KAA0989267.1 hypothetical protein FXO21_03370 [Dyadobacter sp. UC 10]